MCSSDRIIVALDMAPEPARELARRLQGHARWLKVGMTLYYQVGPTIVKEFKQMGYQVFLDLKLHDIPHQVAGAARAAADTGADLLSIHASGGPAMIEAARTAVGSDPDRMRLVGISVLTSMDQTTLTALGVPSSIPEQVDRLARLAVGEQRADGMVCSPQEAAHLRDLLGPEALIVTPGVRPAGSDQGDQHRIATPQAAFEAGASHLVVGRPITEAPDPVAAFEALLA